MTAELLISTLDCAEKFVPKSPLSPDVGLVPPFTHDACVAAVLRARIRYFVVVAAPMSIFSLFCHEATMVAFCVDGSSEPPDGTISPPLLRETFST